MDDLLKGIGAVVAVVASIGALALAIEQFTLRARLRKTEAWAVAMLAHDRTGERAAALTKTRLEATSRIVAGIFMPVRFFAEGVLWALAAPAVVVVALLDDTLAARGLAALVGFAFVSLTLSTRRAIRLYLERCRIASEYRRDQVVTEARRGMLDLMEGGLRVEFAFAIGFSLGVCALAVGVGLALSGVHVDGWPLVLMLAGGGMAYTSVDLLRLHARRQHPIQA